MEKNIINSILEKVLELAPNTTLDFKDNNQIHTFYSFTNDDFYKNISSLKPINDENTFIIQIFKNKYIGRYIPTLANSKGHVFRIETEYEENKKKYNVTQYEYCRNAGTEYIQPLYGNDKDADVTSFQIGRLK